MDGYEWGGSDRDEPQRVRDEEMSRTKSLARAFLVLWVLGACIAGCWVTLETLNGVGERRRLSAYLAHHSVTLAGLQAVDFSHLPEGTPFGYEYLHAKLDAKAKVEHDFYDAAWI